MGGFSDAVDCPRCGSIESLERLQYYNDVSGCCLLCGYEFKTVHTIITLKDLNERRMDLYMEPLTELKMPVEGWIEKT